MYVICLGIQVSFDTYSQVSFDTYSKVSLTPSHMSYVLEYRVDVAVAFSVEAEILESQCPILIYV